MCACTNGCHIHYAMKFDNIQQSRILTRILIAIGLWPKSSDSTKWFANYFPSSYTLLLHGPLTFTYITLMWLYLILESNLERAFEVLYIALTETALLVKLFSILHFFKLAKRLVTSWEHSRLYELHNAEERSLWQRKQKSFGLISFIYIFCSISVVISAFIAELFHTKKQCGFHFWLPFDWSQQASLYWLCYTYSFVSMMLTCITNITLDMMHCYLMLHCALCFQLVGMRLKQLKETHSAAHTRNEMCQIIKLHQAVKHSAKDCESIVSYPSLAQIILSAFVLCFSIYRLQGIRISDDPGTFFSMLQYGLVMTLQIYLPCYYANEITIESQALADSLYNSDWIHMSASNRRFIFLYMEYLKRPVILRAGHFFTMGLPIFTKTMNNSYSLLALLLNMDD